MPGYVNDVDGYENSTVGETPWHRDDLDSTPLYFVVTAPIEQRYGPFYSLTSLYWNAGFITGCLASGVCTPGEVRIDYYLDDELIESR